MKRLVEDAKGLYAFARAQGDGKREATEYFVEAANGVRENRQRYDEAQSAAQTRPRAPKSDYIYYPPPTDND